MLGRLALSDAGLGLTDPLDFDLDVPVYAQIKNRLTFAIGRGAYAADAQLPSVRALARALLVNPNTVVRVYRELEQEGLIYSRRGKGVFVAAQAARRCRKEGQALVEDKLREALALARRAQLEGDELEALWRELRGSAG